MSAPTRWKLTRDVDLFTARVERFLAARIERNVLATVLVNVRTGRYSANRPLFAYALDQDGTTVAAAMRTPPWPLLVSDLNEPLAEELIERWLVEDPLIDAVTGEAASTQAFAGVWRRRTGRDAGTKISEAAHSLSAVIDPPRPAGGHLRAANQADRELLIVWEREFVAESGVSGGANSAQLVDGRLASRTQYVWEDDGPVSTLAHSPIVAGVARIGPVYTPVEHRCHGYASSAVAALSRRLLEIGAERCMLFTDLGNPTSNKIYADVGYRRFGYWEELDLRSG